MAAEIGMDRGGEGECMCGGRIDEKWCDMVTMVGGPRYVNVRLVK
jgi:hypothetical protein